MTRALAHIEKVVSLDSIPNSDNIVKATVLGWECVVKKDEFKVGDTVVYIETDSILPMIPYFFFMEPRRYRVRTIKLRKQVSQGLVLPLSAVTEIASALKTKVCTDHCWDIGEDLTELLGIRKHDPQGQEEDLLTQQKQSKSKIHKFLLRYSWYRALFPKKKKQKWPPWIQKTDEERIQNMPSVLVNSQDMLVCWTEKLDGQSASYSYKKYMFLKVIPKWIFTVCSRNTWQKTKQPSNYWAMATKYDLEAKLKAYNKEILIQGEICGPSIQKNKYGLKELKFFVFNVCDLKTNTWYSRDNAKLICDKLGLEMVPLLGCGKLKDNFATVPECVQFSKGKSLLANRAREGIVVRQMNNSEGKGLSFKVINPDFLLGLDEDE